MVNMAAIVVMYSCANGETAQTASCRSACLIGLVYICHTVALYTKQGGEKQKRRTRAGRSMRTAMIE